MVIFYAENVDNIKQKIIFSQTKIKSIEIIKELSVKNAKDLENKNIGELKKLVTYRIMLEFQLMVVKVEFLEVNLNIEHQNLLLQKSLYQNFIRNKTENVS